MSTIAVAIPAYNPDEKLIQLVEGLTNQLPYLIVIVDDGSKEECKPIFDALKKFNVVLLRHDTNRGKGAALKTAFNYLIKNTPDLVAVITADADFQHSISDIEMIAHESLRQPQMMHLGVREFEKDVPLRSLFGNKITRWAYRTVAKQDISDTQTGLRGIPRVLLESLCEIKYDGYEFELEMLFIARDRGVGCVEHKIKTIYYEGNKGSHFRPLIDSIKIYWVLSRYTMNSFLSFLIELGVFFVCRQFFFNLLASLIVARAISGAYNFTVNKYYVFRSRQYIIHHAMQYIALAGICIMLSYFLIRLFLLVGINVYVGKVLADILIYTISFNVQHFIIFRKKC